MTIALRFGIRRGAKAGPVDRQIVIDRYLELREPPSQGSLGEPRFFVNFRLVFNKTVTCPSSASLSTPC
jgi:hypothetical protein